MRPDEVPLLEVPGGQRPVLPVAAGEGVRPRLDGAPVLPGGDRHRVDAVHDRPCCGWPPGTDRPGRTGSPGRCPRRSASPGQVEVGQQRHRNAAAGPRQPPVGEVGEDAQVHLAAGDLLDERGDALGDGVDEVRAHRVLGVDQQVHDEQRLAPRPLGRGQHAHLDVLRARRPAAPSAGGSCWPARGSAPCAPRILSARLRRVAVAGDLHLADHQRVVGVGREPARLADDLRGERHRGHHRWLLDRHGHQVVAAVDRRGSAPAPAAG